MQMEHFLSGVYYVVRKSALRCLSWRHAEVRAMGEPFIDIDVLRKYTKNKTVSISNDFMKGVLLIFFVSNSVLVHS